MFKIDAEEKARAGYLVDRLAPLGGFIGEEAENKMRCLYPPKLVKMAKNYCQTDKEVLSVLERMESITKEISEHGSDDAELLYRTLRVEDEFSAWFIRQNIKAEAERLQESSTEKSKYPEILSSLEQKILGSYIEKSMELTQLAEEMDCKEDDEYVVLVLHYIKRKLKSGECEIKELEERLEAEKLELDW